jgi:hypothetical protein
MSGSSRAARPLVLVAEPQALPAMWLEDLLEDEGYDVLGPYATCEAAGKASSGTLRCSR